METIFGIHTIARFDLFGLSFPVPVGIVVQWGVMAFAFLIVWLSSRNMKPVPGLFQNFSEILAATLRRWVSRRDRATRGSEAAMKPRRFSPEGLSALVITAFVFIFSFWISSAITTLPVKGGPISDIVAFLTPLVVALEQKTILGPILGRFGGRDIGVEITAALQVKEAFGFDLFGMHIMVADVVIVMWIVMAFLFIVALWLGRGFHPVPKGKQLVAENLVTGIQSLVGTVMEPGLVDRYVPYVGSIMLFIGVCNITSTFRLPPPAKNPAFPISLALLAIASVLFFSIREVGFKGFARSMLYPKASMLPFKIIDLATKIISLSLRLFGNIFGAFVFMEFINIIMPLLLPGLIGLWFDIADGLIQGLVFGYLTALYIGEVVENARHEAA